MKKTRIFLAALATASIFTACTQYEIGNDNIPTGDITYDYSVQVVPVGDVKSTEGLEGAIVTIQTNDKKETATVDANGIAVFKNVKPGYITGYVEATGYLNVNFTANLTSQNYHNAKVDRNAASTIYAVKENGDVKGRIYGDFDFDGAADPNDANDRQAGIKVSLIFGVNNYPLGNGDGQLSNVNFDHVAYSSTTNAAGEFSFANIPTTINNYVSSQIIVEDLELIDAGVKYIFKAAPVNVNSNPGFLTNLGDIVMNP